MPEESTTPDLVELVGMAFEAANRRDIDAVVSSFAEDAIYEGRALGDRFEGRAAIRSFLEEWFGSYEELEFGLEEVRDLGNGLCLPWSLRTVVRLAAPVTFDNARDGSSSGYEV
jgi:ketosteroid isomerase-like protein